MLRKPTACILYRLLENEYPKRNHACSKVVFSIEYCSVCVRRISFGEWPAPIDIIKRSCFYNLWQSVSFIQLVQNCAFQIPNTCTLPLGTFLPLFLSVLKDFVLFLCTVSFLPPPSPATLDKCVISCRDNYFLNFLPVPRCSRDERHQTI